MTVYCETRVRLASSVLSLGFTSLLNEPCTVLSKSLFCQTWTAYLSCLDHLRGAELLRTCLYCGCVSTLIVAG